MKTGDYNVPLLPPAVYQVSAEKSGFRRSVYRAVNLDVDQTARVDFTLQVGEVNEDIAVTDTVPLVQTDTSTLGQVIDRRQVHELPLNERNFLSFALLVPGGQMPAEGSQNSTQGGSISVNGAREQSNNFLLDGVDNNDPYINQYVALPSIDAIQEFKVQSSDYSAEFGRSGGGQINVVIRSGSNQFHGSAIRVHPQPEPGCQELLRSARLHLRLRARHLRRNPPLRSQPVRRDPGRAHPQGQDLLLRLLRRAAPETGDHAAGHGAFADGARRGPGHGAPHVPQSGRRGDVQPAAGGQRRPGPGHLEHLHLLSGHSQLGEHAAGQSGPPCRFQRLRLGALRLLR